MTPTNPEHGTGNPAYDEKYCSDCSVCTCRDCILPSRPVANFPSNWMGVQPSYSADNTPEFLPKGLPNVLGDGLCSARMLHGTQQEHHMQNCVKLERLGIIPSATESQICAVFASYWVAVVVVLGTKHFVMRTPSLESRTANTEVDACEHGTSSLL